jgi:cytochrome c oxidase assembly protein subunit 15
LLAETIGLAQIGLTFVLIRRRRDLKKLAWLLLAMVCVQGGLGALTVYYKLPWYVSTLHLLTGMSYFATLIYTAFRTRSAPSVMELERHDRRVAELGAERTWIVIAAGTVLVQLLIGALVRHLGAALVCLGMPSCTMGGDWWPEASVQDLHMVHRLFGCVVAVVTIVAAARVYARTKAWPALRTLSMIAPALVGLQIFLGIEVVLTWRSVPVAVGHFAGATALWGLWVSAYLLTTRRMRTRRDVVEAVAV